MIRPAYVHPSGLSPTEHEAYLLWISELEAQVAKLDRGLRFGEMLAFIRRRTPVERENEVCRSNMGREVRKAMCADQM
jgi:hypothetical protein